MPESRPFLGDLQRGSRLHSYPQSIDKLTVDNVHTVFLHGLTIHSENPARDIANEMNLTIFILQTENS
jgi:hypothetical protein